MIDALTGATSPGVNNGVPESCVLRTRQGSPQPLLDPDADGVGVYLGAFRAAGFRREVKRHIVLQMEFQAGGEFGFLRGRHVIMSSISARSSFVAPVAISPTHGAQEGTAWNGRFGCMFYYPLFVFNQFGHLERCALRPGNVHSADEWEAVLKPVIARYADRHLMRFFRADAAFAIPDLYKLLEAVCYFYTIRLRANRILQSKVAYLLKRPAGRPPKHVRRLYGDFEYQAASWDKPRRVIAKVEWHPGELFPRVGLVVTNLPMDPDWIIHFYNQRGTAEQHIKEGKQAINWTRLSCKGMAQNEVRLQLHALAYNLGVFLQGADLPEEMADRSLTSLQTRLIKTGARVVRHARATTFQLAEVAVSGALFRRILAAIHRLRAPPVPT